MLLPPSKLFKQTKKAEGNNWWKPTLKVSTEDGHIHPACYNCTKLVVGEYLSSNFYTHVVRYISLFDAQSQLQYGACITLVYFCGAQNYEM